VFLAHHDVVHEGEVLAHPSHILSRLSRQTNHLIAEPPLDRSPDARGLSPRSMLFLTLLLLDLRLPRRISLGSVVGKPLAFANSIKISVKLTTPAKCPLIRAPGNELAETDGPVGVMKGDALEGGA
jgi:hypothetical protein